METSAKAAQIKPRDSFTSNLGVLAATLGSAIGLGNIWKFPYITGENGGAAFILVYLVCVLLVGLPVMIAELLIGRKTKANAVGAFKQLEPGRPWYLIGLLGAVSSFLIMAFYTNVAGWVYAYVFKSATGSLLSTNPTYTSEVFNGFITAIWSPLIWQWITLLIVGGIITAGVSKGIERITKTLMPVLFLLLIICGIRALTLPGAAEGLKFLFYPDFSKITWGVVLAAMGLSFFKLSLGMGTMITYGSYMGNRQDIPRTAFKVMLSDTIVSLLAGIAIFPAVFAFGFEPSAGPSLLFITIPTVFASMPYGTVFMALFFILVSIAATTAMISLLEVPVAYFCEEFRWPRMKATFVCLGILAVIGASATLSTSVLADFKVWDKNLFDLYDFLTSNVIMPISGIAVAVYLGWRWGNKKIQDEASNQGEINNIRFVRVLVFILKYIAPVAITAILIKGLM